MYPNIWQLEKSIFQMQIKLKSNKFLQFELYLGWKNTRFSMLSLLICVSHKTYDLLLVHGFLVEEVIYCLLALGVYVICQFFIFLGFKLSLKTRLPFLSGKHWVNLNIRQLLFDVCPLMLPYLHFVSEICFLAGKVFGKHFFCHF